MGPMGFETPGEEELGKYDARSEEIDGENGEDACQC